jgi:hypothetical protein
LIGGLVWANPPVHHFFAYVWGWLPAAVTICYGLNVRAGNRQADVLLKAALISGLAGFMLYHLFPAAGAAYAFGPDFPAALPEPGTLDVAPAPIGIPGAPRNSMPCVHFSWALLAWLEARRYLSPVARGAFAGFALLTVLATIGLGEHYVIDNIVAVPFTLGIHALFDKRPARLDRWSVVIFSAVMVAIWLIFLHFWVPGSEAAVRLQLLTVLTIGASILIAIARFQPVNSKIKELSSLAAHGRALGRA